MDFSIHLEAQQSLIMMRKSTKGTNMTSDYIPYRKAMEKGQELLMNPKKTRIGFLIILGVNSGMRISDLLARKHWELGQKQAGDTIRIQEQKTGKYRDIDLNGKIVDSYRMMCSMLDSREDIEADDHIFRSQKGTVYRIVSVNDVLKKEFAGVVPRVSSHSLRKSFGRQVYDQNGRTEDALIELSEIFRYESLRMTRVYLGIRRERIKNIYMNL